MINPFYKTKLIYQISQHIAEQRQTLLEDLVAYSKDPVRYKRRMRMLIQLAEYEQQLLKKINAFETNDQEDIGNYNAIEQFKYEVRVIVNTDS
jgi:hypothetical protein